MKVMLAKVVRFPGWNWIRRFLPAGALLAVGILLSVTIFRAVRKFEDQNVKATFHDAALQSLYALETQITLTLNSMASLGSFYDASHEVERGEFARFAGDRLARHRQIQALEWIPKVPRTLRGRYEAEARQEGSPSFQITERDRGLMVRAGERQDYYPVFYVEPFRGNEKALGFDLASDSVRLEALQRAASTGQMAATARISLVQEQADQYGFLVFRPVYRGGILPPAGELRQRALYGFVLGVFRLKNIVESASPVASAGSGIAVAIFDLDAKSGERLLYPRHALFASDAGLPTVFKQNRLISVGGRKWEMVVYPLSNAFRPARWSSWSILAAELLVTFLLAAYLHLTRGQKLAIQRTVAERTSELNTALQDLSALNRALAKSERTYQKLGEISTDAILIERRHAISSANRAAVQLFKVAGPQDLIGRRVADFASPSFRAVAEEADRKMYSAGMQLPAVEGQILCADNSVANIEISISSFSDNDDTTVQAVLRDISDRKRAQAELVSAKDLAESASRAKSMFLATMSHELRTPLNAILGFSELLKVEMEERGLHEWEQYLGTIHRSGTHLLELINGILDLSKIDAGKMELSLEDLDISTIVRDVAAAAEPLAAKNGNAVRIVCEPAILYGDRDRIRQCLLNLVENACKFTHRGEVLIEGRVEEHAPDGVDGSWYLLSVVDNGIGIAPEDIAKLFSDFTQVDGSRTRRYGGAGLGLAVSRRLCRLMGGDIAVDSTFGQGSTFTMRIPLRPAPKVCS
jgi:PAS domain S-box-containing protein